MLSPQAHRTIEEGKPLPQPHIDQSLDFDKSAPTAKTLYICENKYDKTNIIKQKQFLSEMARNNSMNIGQFLFSNAIFNSKKLYETLTRVQIIEPYYNYDIPGREYEDNEFYQTNEMADNRSALRSFATDKIHREMVRSQYDKE